MKVTLLSADYSAKTAHNGLRQSCREGADLDMSKLDLNLTAEYVQEFNRGISSRIQDWERSHADSADLVAKARFR